MSKSIGFHLAASILLLTSTAATFAAESLGVYTWALYIDPDLVDEFEAEFDTNVRFTYFDSDDERDTELATREGAGYDIILVNRVQMDAYIKKGWISPIDPSIVTNYRHIDPRWSKTSADGEGEYGAAYFWGTMGISWRSNLYPEGFSTWNALLEPDEQLRGRIMMPAFGRELVGFALLSQGNSVNTADRALIRAAGEMLQQQRPFVKGYGMPSLDEESSLVSGSIWASPMYSGDALILKDIDERIEYVLPDEGGMQWVDYQAVTGKSRKKRLAMEFTNFLNRPEVAARDAEYVYYSSPNLASQQFVSEDYLSNPVNFSSEEQMKTLEFLESLPARSTKSVNTVMTGLRAN